MLAQFLISTHTYYSRNYAGIIAASLSSTPPQDKEQSLHDKSDAITRHPVLKITDVLRSDLANSHEQSKGHYTDCCVADRINTLNLLSCALINPSDI